jgi:hypothetical protein
VSLCDSIVKLILKYEAHFSPGARVKQQIFFIFRKTSNNRFSNVFVSFVGAWQSASSDESR